MITTATRVLEFDAAHRVFQHESKCAHPHGHRYKVEITVSASELDSVGRVIDFSVIKSLVGKWIDENWDHAFVYYCGDAEVRDWLEKNNFRRYALARNPTAENMAEFLFELSNSLLGQYGINCEKIKVWETPNCFSEVSR